MRIALVLILVAVASLAIWFSLDMTALTHWAAAHQRGFQNQMPVPSAPCVAASRGPTWR